MTAPATWFVITGASDYYWRVYGPARAIGGKVCAIPEEGGYFALTHENDDTVFPWKITDGDPGVSYPALEGTAVWTRPDLPRATHARAMKDLLGARIVAEVDDNYLADARQNLFMRANNWDAQARTGHLKAVCSMDALVTTTAVLRDTYYRALKDMFGRPLLPEFHVCDNHVFLDDWPQRIERDGPLRVGWMGSTAHVWDIDLAWPAFMHAKNLGCETIVAGYNPADPEGFPIESNRAYNKALQWRKTGIRELPWKQLDGTQRLELPFDIGLCPLVHNDFTMGKSDIKAVEYTIAGAAVVASASPVYTRNWVHGETCLIASSPQQMLDHVDLLVKKPSLRERLVRNAQQYVREERDMAKHATEWEDAVGAQADLQGVQPADRQVALRAGA